MSTVIQLTDTPVLVSSKAVFIQSKGGVFNFAFGSSAPSNLSDCHTTTEIYSDGSLGNLYAWKNPFQKVKLIVSEAI